MHTIETGYEAMVEAVVEANLEKRSRLWAASAAWYLYRRNTLMARPYWGEIAAKLSSELSDYDLDRIAEQLTNPERLLVDDALEEWPVVPDMLQSVLDRWNPPQGEIDLDAARAEAVRSIDNSAEQYRTNFITPGSGQAMAYQQKLEEARAYAANPAIPDSAIPHVVLEAEVDGMSKEDKVTQIITMFQQWQQVSAVIEAKRAQAKAAVAAATTKAEIIAAKGIVWEPVE